MGRLPLLLLAMLLWAGSAAQVTVKLGPSSDRLTLQELRDNEDKVAGLGEAVPGVELKGFRKARHFIGPASDPAGRESADSSWALLRASRDSVVQGLGLHWVRIPVRPEDALKGMPMLLDARAKVNFEVYLNGKFLVRSAGENASPPIGVEWQGRALQRVVAPFTFMCDGAPEVIAVRISGTPGGSFKDTGFDMALRTGDVFLGQQRRMVHTGLFIGINLVILLFAFIMWRSEARERTWLLLVFLSLAAALDTLTDAGLWAQLPTAARELLVPGLKLLLAPWQLYLMMLLMGMLLGRIRFLRWQTIAVLFCTVVAVVGAMANPFRENVTIDTPSQWVWLGIGIGALALYGLAVGWFLVTAISRGIRLSVRKDHVRWVGMGVVVSLLLAFMLNLGAQFSAGEFAQWLQLAGNYAGNAALPIAVAVFLAARSAHNNRLVARQRDELDQEVQERTAELSAEKERSEELLLNILPAQVAEELKNKGAADARSLEQVTVLFTDFQGFTALSAHMAPERLVADIHECFSAFDAIMGRHGVEKIKTIGDAYMAAGGLPVPNGTHARDAVLAALEVQEFIAARKAGKQAAGEPFFEVRIGVHTGPVVAGIVGVKKFQYDIWGDTVNTASRMESSGAVGRVNISEATYAWVKDVEGLAFIPRGPVKVKGKGELAMWFVERA